MKSHNRLAVDFGTSNSLVGAICNGQKVEALPIDPHSADPTLMRTLLYFPTADVCYYGAEAISQFIENDMDGRLFRSFKSHLPNDKYLGTMMDNRVLTLENLIGTFLLELKKRAEKILDTSFEEVVLGRPARYSMNDVSDGFAVHRMRKAAEFAGFKEVKFVPEPLAAALDSRRNMDGEKLVLIGDFGGGTSDFTLMRMSNREFQKEDVLGIDGCALAGDALDSLFMSQRLNRSFGAHAKYRLPLTSNTLTMPPSVMDRLNKPSHIVHLREPEVYNFIREIRKSSLTKEDQQGIDRLFVLMEDQQIFSFFEEIEKSKRGLSAQSKADFKFDYPGIEVTDVFFRNQFEEWATKFKGEIFEALDRCMKQASVQSSQIDLVFLTGGTAHVPFIRSEFESRFGKDKLQTKTFFHSVLSGLVESAQYWDKL